MFKRIVNGLNSVKVIDNHFNKLAKSPDQLKIEQLLARIEDQPEISKLLSKFLRDLNGIGINQKSDRTGAKWGYYARMMKYTQLHTVFWELCGTHDISQHHHKLRWDVNNIGLLDPRNFPPEYYKQVVDEVGKEKLGVKTEPEKSL